MASIHGAQFHYPGSDEQVTDAQTQLDAGRLSLASIAEVHTSISGGLGHDVGATGSDPAAAGFDPVSEPSQAGLGFAGELQPGADQVVAVQTLDGGNTVLHLADGSTITLVGVTHVDASFFS
jgi:hypothetical protein